MEPQILRRIILEFNYVIIYYVLIINFIYFLQLVLAAFNLSDYIKKLGILIIEDIYPLTT